MSPRNAGQNDVDFEFELFGAEISLLANSNASEQVFASETYYTGVTQATRQGFVHRFDTHQGRP